MATESLEILNIHTPTNSFAIPHSVSDGSYAALTGALARKVRTEYDDAQIGEGWLKYEWNDAVWSLDDDSDYSIFAWRQRTGSSSTNSNNSPTLYLHDPARPLPPSSSYRNPAFYLFRRQSAGSRASSPRSKKNGSVKSVSSRKTSMSAQPAVPKHKEEFDRFHGANGVRTVIGTIGSVNNVRMLLKESHRHVYVSRKFAVMHGFVPTDAEPGRYGYGGLVNIGKLPISLGPTPNEDGKKPKSTAHTVFLSEESHFDVILGRAFFEARRIKIDPVDLTDVTCGDTGEKVGCEVVVLRDGRGEIVTVT